MKTFVFVLKDKKLLEIKSKDIKKALYTLIYERKKSLEDISSITILDF